MIYKNLKINKDEYLLCPICNYELEVILYVEAEIKNDSPVPIVLCRPCNLMFELLDPEGMGGSLDKLKLRKVDKEVVII